MKKLTKILLLISFVFLTIVAPADGPTPPAPPGDPSGGGQPVGAPIDAGLIVLLVLGACYGAWRLFEYQKSIKKIKAGEVQN
jgi:hypothetical protein